MRLMTYTFRGTTRLGALLGDGDVIDLNRACALHRADRGERRARAIADFLVPADMMGFLASGDPAMDAARAALAFAQDGIRARRDGAIASGLLFASDEPGFRLEAPVQRRGKVLAVGVNYKDHSAETGIAAPEAADDLREGIDVHHRAGRPDREAALQPVPRLGGRALLRRRQARRATSRRPRPSSTSPAT
jgi:hypothetical protein